MSNILVQDQGPEPAPDNGPPLFHALLALWRRIQDHGGRIKEANILERWEHFVRYSDEGARCAYARKYQELFEKHDYEGIKKMFLECLAEYRKVEGENFGR